MSKGYLLPSPQVTDGFRCLRVFVPDNIAHRRAFWGSLYGLASWTTWEKEATHGGALAANDWKEANELTFNELVYGCGEIISGAEMSEILDTINELRTMIEGLEMTVQVINNIGCSGCGCTCSSCEEIAETGVTIINLPEDDTGVQPPADGGVLVIADAARCRFANWFAVNVLIVVRTVGQVYTTPLTVNSVYQLLVVVFTWSGSLLVSVSILVALAVRIVGGLGEQTSIALSMLGDTLEDDFDNLVCALYNWTSPQELSVALNTKMSEYIGVLAVNMGLDASQTDWISDLFYDVFGGAIVNYVTANIATVVPAGFVATVNCSGCIDPTPNTVTVCVDYGSAEGGEPVNHPSAVTYDLQDTWIHLNPDAVIGDPSGALVPVGDGGMLVKKVRVEMHCITPVTSLSTITLRLKHADGITADFEHVFDPTAIAETPTWYEVDIPDYQLERTESAGLSDIEVDCVQGGTDSDWRVRVSGYCIDYVLTPLV